MKIKGLPKSKLRNKEYYQYHSEFIHLVELYGADTIKIEPQFETYIPLFYNVDTAMMKIMKSEYTSNIHTVDKHRDKIFRGLVEKCRASEKHFREEVIQAAHRLKILLDKYGNLAKLPYNEQTSGINNILQELKGRFVNDIRIIGIEEWVVELEESNNAFIELYRQRFNETTEKTDIVLRKARIALDKAFRIIIERINALVIVEGVEQWKDFIKSLNTVTDKYTLILKQREGKAAAKK